MPLLYLKNSQILAISCVLTVQTPENSKYTQKIVYTSLLLGGSSFGFTLSPLKKKVWNEKNQNASLPISSGSSCSVESQPEAAELAAAWMGWVVFSRLQTPSGPR